MVIYAQQLERMGHTVRVISPPPSELSYSRKFKSWLKGKGWPDERARWRSHLDRTAIDHRILDRYRPVANEDVPAGDVVIATWWETAEWVAALSPAKGAKAYFIQHHEIHEYLPTERVRATYRLPFHKIVIAAWLKRVMSEQYGDDLVEVVPNSVDRTRFFAPNRGKQSSPSVGFLYSSTPFKGVDVTMAALRIVSARIPGLRIISFATQRPSRHLALPKGTEFHYSPPQNEIRNLYARCDAWITASRSEGFNLPALEAMACRTPVVSTKTGWPEEAIKSGWNGMLVDIDDVQGLAQAITWVLSRSDPEWRVLSANAYGTASEGSWEESARMFERALKHARARVAQGEAIPHS
jgi:glycosyltransferase involved in cell wall biosynthesis